MFQTGQFQFTALNTRLPQPTSTTNAATNDYFLYFFNPHDVIKLNGQCSTNKCSDLGKLQKSCSFDLQVQNLELFMPLFYGFTWFYYYFF